MEETIQTVNNYKSSKKVLNVGNFSIQVNTSCEIEIGEPPQPPLPPVVDCIKGRFDGQLLAKSIATLTKNDPIPGSVVSANMADCNLMGSLEVTMDIYH